MAFLSANLPRHVHGLVPVGEPPAFIVGGDASRSVVFQAGITAPLIEYAASDLTLSSGTTRFDPSAFPQLNATGGATWEMDAFHVCPDGSYLAHVWDSNAAANGESYIYRCADPVAAPNTWAYVFEPSSDGVATINSGAKVLGNQAFASVIIGADWHVILANYNPDGSPVFCRSWISPANTTAGTWTVHWEPSPSGGVERVKHFHAVYQNPNTLDIVYLCGDGALTGGIVAGPAQTSWSAVDDMTVANVVATAGWSGSVGTRSDVAIQVAFIDEHLVFIPDNPGENANRGFWRVPDDFSTPKQRVRYFPWHDETSADFNTDYIGCSVYQLENGEWLIGDVVNDGASGNLPMHFYITQTGRDFWPAGFITVDNAAGSQANNTVMIDGFLWISGQYYRRVISGNKTVVCKHQGPAAALGKELLA